MSTLRKYTYECCVNKMVVVNENDRERGGVWKVGDGCAIDKIQRRLNGRPSAAPGAPAHRIQSAS